MIILQQKRDCKRYDTNNKLLLNTVKIVQTEHKCNPLSFPDNSN